MNFRSLCPIWPFLGEEKMPNIVGVILAGGKSRRMGVDKTFLEIGGVPLIERAVQTLLPLFPTVAIVSKEVEKFHLVKGVSLVRDLFPEQHALGGIYTALSYFQGKGCFIFACDLPFLNPSLISFMIQKMNGYDILVPKSHHGLEPLHAIYSKRCLGAMEELIRQKEWGLKSFIRGAHYGLVNSTTLHTFDPEEISFLNVNTPEEFQKAKASALSP